MLRKSEGVAWPASVSRAIDVIADKWASLILRDAFIGPCRFDGLQRSTGISKHTLTRRLSALQKAGLLERQQYETRPPRFEYVLTDKGRELYGVYIALKGWGDKWLAQPGDTELHLWHRPCGGRVHGAVVCEHCQGVLRPNSMDFAVQEPDSEPDGKSGKSSGTVRSKSSKSQ